ncbi:hypothetical protein EV217_5122 [Phyllobacterium myrsinacearum]|uniref:DUF2971 domain-containing protein n=1 Tax=Phyllobacterium myrsinacearum TaxID=28101 RepID=UPI0010288EEE|nr:DUF2971 domain-containing protein [Phyllobacterium myrsinacearum]RZS76890.1 hypothetical protein EV217_5122 [Phyllobacterium myrsinacearum]
MNCSSDDNIFRRFTNLAAVIHLLQTRQITLLTPDTWDDRNDRHFMEVYKKRKELKTLTAVCLSQGPETYHHWRVFSPNGDGVCVVLRKDKLLKTFTGKQGVRHQAVHYKQLSELPKLRPPINDLPFIKRYPYEPESEYRILYEDSINKAQFTNFSLLPGTVDAIILSPWMPNALVDSVKATLKMINGASRIRMYASTLISNQDWQKVADRAT